jgi:hypothetical protein
MNRNQKLPENYFKYDSWIQEFSNLYKLPWKLIKAQVWQESAFDPNAVSSCGAMGLMQLMPETDFMLDGHIDGTKDPKGNLVDGIKYDRWLFDRFPEIPNEEERTKFALAAYNGGRGYVNKAIEISYDCEFGEPIPAGHKNPKPGRWQLWCHTSAYLCSPYCVIKDRKSGKTLKPDYRQMLDYVDHIWEKYEFIKLQTSKVLGTT